MNMCAWYVCARPPRTVGASTIPSTPQGTYSAHTRCTARSVGVVHSPSW